MNKDDMLGILIILIASVIFFPFAISLANGNTAEWAVEENESDDSWFSEVECTIKEKWVKRTEEEDKYLVSCDNEVYQITDNLLYGKVNSSDIYAQLEIGKKYKLEVSGFRFGLTSSYKNINSATLIEEGNNG